MSLQTGGQVLLQDVPSRAMYPASNLTSTSDACLNRRHMELPPRNDTQFQPGGNSEIEIRISSNTSFIDLENSYLRGELEVGGTIGGTAAAYMYKTMLEEGGIHSLFSAAELRIASTGTVIERLNLYNLFCAMESEVIHSPQEVNGFYMDELDSAPEPYQLKVLCPKVAAEATATSQINIAADNYETSAALGAFLAGDFQQGDRVSGLLYGSSLFHYDGVISAIRPNFNLGVSLSSITTTTATPASAADTIGGLVATGSAIIFEYDAKEGDGQGAPSHVSNVVRVTAVHQTTGVITFTPEITAEYLGGVEDNIVMRVLNGIGMCVHPAPAQTVANHDASYLVFESLSKKEQYSIRERVATEVSSKIRFCMKPRLGWMRQNKLFPLFLLAGGIDLVLRLDSNFAYRSFTRLEGAYKNYNTAMVPRVSIDKVRFCAVMLDLHSSINQEFLNLYRGQGLLIPFIQYNVYESRIEATDGQQTLDLRPGVRSARWAVSRMIPDSVWNSNNYLSRSIPILSTHFGLGVKEWQYESGSLVWPVRSVVIDNTTPDPYALENFKHQNITYQRIRCMSHTSDEDVVPIAAGPSCRSGPDAYRRKAISCDYSTTAITGATGYTNVDKAAIDFQKFLMPVVLGRDLAGKFAGVDLSIQPLRLSVNLESASVYPMSTYWTVNGSGVTPKRVVHTVIASDAYLHLSEATGATILT